MAKKKATKSETKKSETKKLVVKKKPAVAAATGNTEKQTLRKWNVWLALLCAAQGIAILLIGKSFALPITTQYLAVDSLATEATGEQVVAPATRTLFDVRLSWLIAAFLLVTAAVYLVQATVYRARYDSQLERGFSAARWAGLGVSGGLAFVIVALLSGIFQWSTLLMLFVFMVVGCGLALVTEMLTQDRGKSRLSHVVCTAALVCVLMPVVAIAASVKGAVLYGGSISNTLYTLYASLAVLFVAFLLLTHFRLYRKGKWASSIQTERAYMLLGFVTASVLAWQVFAGFLY